MEAIRLLVRGDGGARLAKVFGVGKDYTNASHLGSPFSRKYTSVGVGVGAAFHSIVIVGR